MNIVFDKAKYFAKKYVSDQKEFHKRRKEVAVLFKQTGVPLVLFVLGIFIVKNVVVNPLISKIWNLALSVSPQKYITTENLWDVLESPLVVVCAVFVFLFMSIFSVWQTAVILTCGEYVYQRKRLTFVGMLVEPFKNVMHIFHPKNWLILVFSSILLPWLDVYNSSSTAFKVPLIEYFVEFCLSNKWMTALLVVAFISLYILLILSFFVFCRFILFREDFFTAIKNSYHMVKSERRRNVVQVSAYKLISRIQYTIIPLVIIYLVVIIGRSLLPNHFLVETFLGVTDAYIFTPLLNILSTTFICITTLHLFLILFHDHLRQTDGEMPLVNSTHISERDTHFKPRPIIVASYAILYVLVALYMLLINVILPKKLDIFQEDLKQVGVVAHKGLHDKRTVENSKYSIQKALDLGECDYIEVDVRTTKDGVVVLSHNDTTDKYTRNDKPIREMTFEEFKNMKLTPVDELIYSDTGFISLDEALTMTDGKVPLLIEIKESGNNIEQSVVDLIKAHNATSCLVQSTDVEILEKVKEISPTTPCGIVMVFSTGENFDRSYIDFYSVEHSFVDNDEVEKIHGWGKKVFAWTINDSDEMMRYAAMGVDYIITDKPSSAGDVAIEIKKTIENGAQQINNL